MNRKGKEEHETEKTKKHKKNTTDTRIYKNQN